MELNGNLLLSTFNINFSFFIYYLYFITTLLFEGGIVMGADSRATAGNIVADKHCMKVHKLTNSIYACGAGTAADLDQVLIY